MLENAEINPDHILSVVTAFCPLTAIPNAPIFLTYKKHNPIPLIVNYSIYTEELNRDLGYSPAVSCSLKNKALGSTSNIPQRKESNVFFNILRTQKATQTDIMNNYIKYKNY